MMRGNEQHDQQSKVFCELSALVYNLLRSPSFVPETSSRRSPAPVMAQITPAGFASLLLGISVSLMLCGSVTFFIGFLLMPWVIGLLMVCYVAGIFSSLCFLCRSILCYVSPRKDVPGYSKFLSKRDLSIVESFISRFIVKDLVQILLGFGSKDYEEWKLI